MSHIEARLRTIYDDARHTVGKKNNRALVPTEFSALLALRVAKEFAIEIPDNYYLDAFWLKEAPLYPDAYDFFSKIGKVKGALPVMYTQGEVFNKGLRGDAENLGFQNHKIEVAGIPWYLGKNVFSNLEEHDLAFVHGGFCKTEEAVLYPLLEVIKKLELSVCYFDDLTSNLEMVDAFFSKNSVQTKLFWLNRLGQTMPDLEMQVTEITSFDEVDLDELINCLVMLDYDGTVGDSEAMRKNLFDQVLNYTNRLIEGR